MDFLIWISFPFWPIAINIWNGMEYSKTFSSSFRFKVSLFFLLGYWIFLALVYFLIFSGMDLKSFQKFGGVFVLGFFALVPYSWTLKYYYYYKSTSYSKDVLVFDRLKKYQRHDILNMIKNHEISEVFKSIEHLNLPEIKMLEIDMLKASYNAIKSDFRLGIISSKEKDVRYFEFLKSLTEVIKKL